MSSAPSDTPQVPSAPGARPSTIRNALWLAGGTGLGQLLLVAAAPILTRLYRPDDLGMLGLFLAFIGIVSVALSLRYDAAIPTTRSPREASLLTLGAVALAVPASLLFSGLFLGLVAGSFLGYGVLPVSAAGYMLPALLLTALFAVLRNWHIREEGFHAIARATFAQNGVRALGQVALGAAGLGWHGLFLGDLAGRMGGLWRLARSAIRSVKEHGRGARRADVTEALRAYRKFPLLSVPSSILDALAAHVKVPFMAHLYGTATAGQLVLMDRVIAMPLTLVGNSVGDAFHGRMAAHARDNPGEARRFFLRTAAGLFVVGLVPTLLLVLFGRALFALVFGDAWREAGAMASILAPMAFAGLVVSPLSRVVFVFQGQELKLVFDVVRLAAVLAVFVWGELQSPDLPRILQWLNGVGVACYALYFLLLLRIVTRATRDREGERP